MKINKVLTPILTLPFAMVINLSTLVSCNNNKEEEKREQFENDSWSNVSFYASEGLESLKKHYGLDSFLGLERIVNVFGVDHNVRVIGEDEDTITNGEITTLKRAALTFQFSTILSQTDENGSGEIIPIEIPFVEEPEDDRASYRWRDSDVRAWLNDDSEGSLKKQLEKSIGFNVLKTVKKYSFIDLHNPGASVSKEDETIFLLSLGDIYSSDRNQLPDEEDTDRYYEREGNNFWGGDGWKTYSYFAKNIRYDFDYLTPIRCLSLSDPNGQNHPYWLRTGYTTPTEIEISETETYDYYGQWVMGADGACGYWFLDYPYPMQNSSICLAPCFCI